MKKGVLTVIAVLLSVSGFGQKTADIGLWGGASTYWGDLQEVEFSQSVNPVYGAFFRYNFNARVSLRAIYLFGKINAVGYIEGRLWDDLSDISYDLPPDWSPKMIHDFSFMIEINYLKYVLGLKKTPVSPYIMGGVGVMYFPYTLDPRAIYMFNQRHNKEDIEVNESVMAPVIPFGMGVKTHIGKRFGIGAEFIIQKLFSDKLDNLDDPLAHINSHGDEVIYNNLWHNNDYTAYLGINLTYKIYLGKEICPAYESKN